MSVRETRPPSVSLHSELTSSIVEHIFAGNALAKYFLADRFDGMMECICGVTSPDPSNPSNHKDLCPVRRYYSAVEAVRRAALIVLAAVLLTALPARAQAIKAPSMHRADWIALGADAGFRGLDVYGTRKVLSSGGRERFLPPSIASHTGALTAFEGAVVATEFLGAWILRRHRHPLLGRSVFFVDAASVAPWAIYGAAFSGHRPIILQPRRKAVR